MLISANFRILWYQHSDRLLTMRNFSEFFNFGCLVTLAVKARKKTTNTYWIIIFST